MEKQSHHPPLVSLAIDNIVSLLEKEKANKIRPFLRGGRKKEGVLFPVKGSLLGGKFDQIKNLPSEIILTIIIRLVFNTNKFNKKDKQSFIEAMKTRGGLTQYEKSMLDIIKKFIGKSQVNLFDLVAPVDNRNKTLLHVMARENNISMFQFLLKHGVKLSENVINARDDFGKTLLHEAAYFMHKEMAKLLVELGAKRYARDLQGRTPLVFLLSKYKELSENLKKIKEKGERLSQAIVVLSKKEEKRRQKIKKENKDVLEIFKFIESDGVNIDVELIKMLVGDGDEAKKIVNIANEDGKMPLHFAVSYYTVEIAKLLIDHGADVNALITKSRNTSLHFAAKRCRGDMVHLLLVYGADRELVDNRNRSPYVEYRNMTSRALFQKASQKVRQSCQNVGLLLKDALYNAPIGDDFALVRFGSSDHRIYIREHLKWDPEGWKGNPNMFR